MRHFFVFVFLMLFFHAAGVIAQDRVVSQQAVFRLVTIAESLHHPWNIAFLPDGDVLVTERRGKLWRIKLSGEKTKINGIPPVHAKGQGGLFDVVLAPDFKQTGRIYFSYAAPADSDNNNTELAYAQLNMETNYLENINVVFRAQPKLEGNSHYGGRILFAPDGTIFLTLGERYDYKSEAQNIGNHLGTIVHINQDGSPASNNPFAGRKEAMQEIFAYGIRNAQGIAQQPETNRIWFHEHGPRGGDEVNILKAGANYGWPKITYGVDYTGLRVSDKTALPGMEQPVIYWTPSIAPSGMAFYNGARFPEWKGDLFVGALAGEHLRRLEVEGDKITGQEVLLKDLGERIRDVREGPDGYLYFVTDSTRGRLIRLEPLER
ncbi:MAG TPA: glucose dehydrogenase [Rhodospirillaceae bacterium]|nr:glucose dehydrogenase [Rhodospirillaceae bacterium]